MALLTGLTIIWCTLLGILIFVRNRAHLAYRSMSLLCLLLAAWAGCNWLSLRPSSIDLRFLWVKLVMAVTIGIPWLFLHFAVYFPDYEDQLRRRIKKAMPILLAWTACLVVISFTPLMFQHYSLVAGSPHLQPGVGVALYGITFIAVFLTGAAQLYLSYGESTGLPRTQLAYILLGLCSTAVVGFVTNFILVVFLNDFTFIALGPVSSLFFVSAVGYALLKHRLLDIRGTILRGAGYMVVLGLSIVGYVIVWHSLLKSLGVELRSSERDVLSILGMLAVAVSTPFVLQVTQYVGKRFFSITVFDRAASQLRIAGIIARALTAEQLRKGIEDVLCADLHLCSCSIVRVGRPTKYFTLLKLIHQQWGNESLPTLIVFDELPESALKQGLRDENVMVIAPLVLHSQALGWLILGQKKSGDAYSAEELIFCQITVSQIALGLHHAMSYGKTRAFNRKLQKEVQKATQDLVEANVQLSQLDQLKDEFVSIASHELRTPMTAIRSYLWLCLYQRSRALPEEVRKHLQVAYEATDRLLVLVKDLLTISQLEAGKLTLAREEVNLDQLVRAVIEILSLSAAEKSVTIRLLAHSDECAVLIDRVKISEVIQNLIGNAVKFSPSHTQVNVKIQHTATSVRITVRDQGRGMTLEDQKHLFQKFGVVQHQYKTVAQQGTGLGLYIAQQFTQLHGGRVKVRSKLGHGTTFIVSLPKVVAHQTKSKESVHALAITAAY